LPAATKEPADRQSRAGWAFRSRRAVALFLVIAAVGLAADLWSKHVVFARLLDDSAIEPRVSEILHTYPLPPDRQSPEFSRHILQQLKLQERICFGLTFTLSTNPGVVFGFNWIPSWTVNIITVVMIGVIAVFFATSSRRAVWLHVALGLILAGAVGNLYDRLFSSVPLPHVPPIKGHVRDFINCGDLYWDYIYNLADAWLVIGVLMIIVHWLWTGRKKQQTPDT
jgi:signal peptidase II